MGGPSAHLSRPSTPNLKCPPRRDLGQQDLPVNWERLSTTASGSRDVSSRGVTGGSFRIG